MRISLLCLFVATTHCASLDGIQTKGNPSQDGSVPTIDAGSDSPLPSGDCPNNCSSHGTCSAGTCTCTGGYTGTDCSTPGTATTASFDDTTCTFDSPCVFAP